MHKLTADYPHNTRRLLLALILVLAHTARGRRREGVRRWAGSATTERELVNGRDLTGWTPAGKGAAADWGVENGSIVCRGKGHTWLRSRSNLATSAWSSNIK